MDERVAELARTWSLADVAPVSVGPGSTVFRARRGSEPVFVKVSDAPHARRREALALQWWQGQGAAALLESDDSGALLIEAVAPGTTVMDHAVDDGVATRLIAETILALQSATDADAATADAAADDLTAPAAGPGTASAGQPARNLPDLPGIGSLGSELTGISVPEFEREATLAGVPRGAALLEAATELLAHLVATTGEVAVLHGDLHHRNVLLDEDDRPVAIDPHGWVGDPCMEPASLLANPRELLALAPDPLGLTLRRVDTITEVTGLDRERVLQWGLVAGVVAEAWALADHNMLHGAPLRLAAALQEYGVAR